MEKDAVGKAWIGGVWTAAPYLATDNGAQALPKIGAYTASVWETRQATQAKPNYALNALIPTNKNDYAARKILLPPLGAMPKVDVAHVSNGIGGLAVHNGIVVISVEDKGQLLFVDAKQKKLLDSAVVDDPRGLAFDASGRLLVLSGNNSCGLRRLQHNLPQWKGSFEQHAGRSHCYYTR